MKIFLIKNIKNKIRSGLLLMAAVGLLLFQLAGTKNVGAQSASDESFKVTTVYFVRHAERGTEPASDPALSEIGKTRSQTLARTLEKAGVKAIYTSQFRRSIQTAEPLSAQLGIAPALLTMTLSPSNPREVSEASIKTITDKIFEHAGGAVLVVGHTNTIPQAIRMLGGDSIPVIDEQKYDDLFVVTIYEKGKAKVVNLKY